MTKSRLGGYAAMIATAGALAAPALAADGVSISFSGRVPTVCRVSMASSTALPLREGRNELGRTAELCNSEDGYRLVLNHPAGLTNAFAVVDGTPVAISANATSTVIVDSSEPADRQRQLALVLSAPLDDAFAISLTAEAKGAIY